jgi:uncharacterized membrane-anchored protein
VEVLDIGPVIHPALSPTTTTRRKEIAATTTATGTTTVVVAIVIVVVVQVIAQAGVELLLHLDSLRLSRSMERTSTGVLIATVGQPLMALMVIRDQKENQVRRKSIICLCVLKPGTYLLWSHHWLQP